VLSSIPVLWESIENIPKGMLTQVRKLCFPFLWFGKKEVDGIPLVRWMKLAMPKQLGGWGIKNIFTFSKALETKRLWRLIYNQMLWGNVMLTKYMAGSPFEEWFCRPKNLVTNSTIVWKIMVDAFPLIGEWEVWKIEVAERFELVRIHGKARLGLINYERS
jgi:hypothetical protein